jgi:hypothetical protein
MKIINLCPKDFYNNHFWMAICDELDVPPESTNIELKISKVTYEKDDQLDIEEDN